MSSDQEPEFLHPRESAGVIVLAESDPRWADSFLVEAARIRSGIGGGVVAVHHVGSTAVPGLVAKPILDILLLVEDSSVEDTYAPALQALGYGFHVREPHWHEHRLFKAHDPKVNLHVFSAGSTEAVRMLAFRDWLRNHPADRNLYELAKRHLAKRQWAYVQDYADAKSTVVNQIMSRALPAT
jgi:GrpB-like predicted nucleotidyltransferase (UPF0157 family)